MSGYVAAALTRFGVIAVDPVHSAEDFASINHGPEDVVLDHTDDTGTHDAAGLLRLKQINGTILHFVS